MANPVSAVCSMCMTPGYRHWRPRHNICSICWSGHCPVTSDQPDGVWMTESRVITLMPSLSHGNRGMWTVGQGKWIYDFESERYTMFYINVLAKECSILLPSPSLHVTMRYLTLALPFIHTWCHINVSTHNVWPPGSLSLPLSTFFPFPCYVSPQLLKLCLWYF